VDFTDSEEMRELAALTRRVLADGGDWATLVKVGVVDPASLGLLEQCSVLTEIGRAVAPVPYLPTVTMAASAIARFGTPEQIERWLIPATRGETTFAVAERGFAAEGGRISGEQSAVPFGATADAFLVPAETSDGVRVFLVEQAEIQRQQLVDNDDAALVRLTDAPGEPVDVDFEWLRQRGTVGLCAMQLGVLESALHRTAEYTKQREQFGHPIATFQAVRQRLADAYVDVEAVRLSLWQAAWRLSEGLPAAEEVATAKYWAAEAGHRVAHTAVHLHGGVGIDVDYPLHKYFVAAKRLEFTLGGATAQLLALGHLLATEPS